MKADFYEDALASAGKRAQMLEAAKEGRVIAGKHMQKAAKGRKLKGLGRIRVFTKEIYCRKRTAKFGIITNTMLFYLLVSVGISLFCVRIMEVSGFLVPGCILFLYFSSGIWEIRLHRRLRETGCFWCRRIHTRKFSSECLQEHPSARWICFRHWWFRHCFCMKNRELCFCGI